MFSFRTETRELNDDVRRQAGGSYADLPGGVTHYELGNPTREQTVILVHGFSVPYYIFDPTFHFLTRHGFRVLRYDLFGRGFSDRPRAQYDIDLFLMQYKGFRRAILSTLRNRMLESFIEEYRKVGRLKKPTLLLWGRHGRTVPLSHSDDLRSAIPHMELHIIEDGLHIPHYEKPEETNALLLYFLRK